MGHDMNQENKNNCVVPHPVTVVYKEGKFIGHDEYSKSVAHCFNKKAMLAFGCLRINEAHGVELDGTIPTPAGKVMSANTILEAESALENGFIIGELWVYVDEALSKQTKLTKMEAEIAADAVQVQAEHAKYAAGALRKENRYASAERSETIAESHQRLSNKLRLMGE